MKFCIITALLVLASCTITMAHGGKKHKKDSTAQADSAKQENGEHIQGDTTHHHDEGMKPDESKVTAELGDFPSLHPLIVHFAIVLIIVAAALQLLNSVLIRKELAWIIGALLFAGCVTAWLASTKYHPHTHGISDHAKLVLEQHDRWADWTNRSALIAMVMQIAYLIFISVKSNTVEMVAKDSEGTITRYKRIGSIAVALLLVVSAYSVSRAGHYGAQLVHIEGIGPQGKFLEMEHEH